MNNKKKLEINIKHITFVINLKNTKAFDYLLFKEKIDNLLVFHPVSTIEFDLINNQYAVLYILPSAIEKTILAEIINCIKGIKTDCIVIDELFPENNEYFLDNISFPQTAKWVKGKQFNTTQSYIEVN
jgi:hypothetical protein